MNAETLMHEYSSGLLLPLPVPIGGEVFIPYCLHEADGSPYEGIEETCLSGYINENGREFFITYTEDYGSADVEPENLCVTKAQAQHRLAELRKEQANGQN